MSAPTCPVCAVPIYAGRTHQCPARTAPLEGNAPGAPGTTPLRPRRHRCPECGLVIGRPDRHVCTLDPPDALEDAEAVARARAIREALRASRPSA